MLSRLSLLILVASTVWAMTVAAPAENGAPEQMAEIQPMELIETVGLSAAQDEDDDFMPRDKRHLLAAAALVAGAAIGRHIPYYYGYGGYPYYGGYNNWHHHYRPHYHGYYNHYGYWGRR